jgi:hypothetical protein
MHTFLRKSGNLYDDSLSQKSLRSLNVCQGIFREKFVELGEFGGYFLQIRIVLTLCYSENHVEAFLREVFPIEKDFPQVIGPEP